MYYTFSIRLFVDGHLEWPHFLAIVTSQEVNMDM